MLTSMQIAKIQSIAPQRVLCRPLARSAVTLRAPGTDISSCTSQKPNSMCHTPSPHENPKTPQPHPTGRRLQVRAAAAEDDIGTLGISVAAAGLLFNPIVLWSEYTKFTTGSGLPEGPYGLLGAAEGIGYLVVLGIVGWSAYTKATTGSGLPAGPSGLLGAAEGFSYLSLLGAVVAFGAAALQ